MDDGDGLDPAFAERGGIEEQEGRAGGTVFAEQDRKIVEKLIQITGEAGTISPRRRTWRPIQPIRAEAHVRAARIDRGG